MPRRPRIDMVGYYHIVNRGVEQRIVYKDKEDFAMFLKFLCSVRWHWIRRTVCG
jgi:hypothetical protein